MLTVAILINNKPIVVQTAVRIKDGHYKVRGTDKIVKHKYEDGAIKLAIKLLREAEKK